MASPASANTSSGCTVTPLKPIFAGFNSSGVKLVNYRISVSCSANRTVSITQERYEEDGWPNPDDYPVSYTHLRAASGPDRHGV